jgi:hypothetical protein
MVSTHGEGRTTVVRTWALLEDRVHGQLGLVVFDCFVLLHGRLLALAALRRDTGNIFVILRVQLHSPCDTFLARSFDGILDRCVLVVCRLLCLFLCRFQSGLSRLYILFGALLRRFLVFLLLQRLLCLGVEVRGLCLVGASRHVQDYDDGDEKEHAVEAHAALRRHCGISCSRARACDAHWGKGRGRRPEVSRDLSRRAGQAVAMYYGRQCQWRGIGKGGPRVTRREYRRRLAWAGSEGRMESTVAIRR